MARKTGQPYKERAATPGLSEFKNIRIGSNRINLRFYGNDVEALENCGALYDDQGAILAKVQSISNDDLVLTIGGRIFCPGLPGHWPYMVQIMNNMVDEFHKLFGVKLPLAEMFQKPSWQMECQLPALGAWSIDELEAGRMLITDTDPALQKLPVWQAFAETHRAEYPAAKRKQGGPRKLTAKSEFPMAVASTARNIQLDFPELSDLDAIEQALAKLSMRPEIKIICIARTKETGSIDSIQNHLRKMKKISS